MTDVQGLLPEKTVCVRRIENVPAGQGQDEKDGYDERQKFETLLIDLSARFVNVPADQLDSEINDALRRICQCLNLDLGVLWENNLEDPGGFLLTHLYRPLGGPPIPERMDASVYFPWNAAESMERKTVAISSLDDIPLGATACDLESWRHFNIKSVLSIPLSAGGKSTFGVIGFCTMTTEREWPAHLRERLEAIAQIFANALFRRRDENALRESEERVSLATAAVNMGLWELDSTQTCFWISDKTQELLGLPPGNSLTLECFMAMVHPDDRQRVRDVIVQSANTQDLATCEYRFERPDGEVRWLLSCGRMHVRLGSVKFMGSTCDITPRKRAEELFRANASRLESTVELAKLGLYEEKGGTEARVTAPDARSLSLLGVPPHFHPDQMRGFWLEHIHPEDLQDVLGIANSFDDPWGVDQVVMEYRFLHAEKGVVWLRHIVHALARDEHGYVVHLVGVLQDVTEQKQAEEKLKQTLHEVQKLRDQLQTENIYLQEQIRSASGHSTILGESESIQRMLTMARKVAPADAAVLITGETGTGKELLAQAIHDMSSRKKRTMVKVNCAALPAPLIESELFGREKGAYTGAMTQQVGRFELANKSTIFLDEIGELPLEIQVKLLRVL